jgi:metal-responsive CopG/Arc/MetJ family transcriptional regulator
MPETPIKPPNDDEESITIGIRIEKKVLKDIDETAWRNSMNRSDYLRGCVAQQHQQKKGLQLANTKA